MNAFLLGGRRRKHKKRSLPVIGTLSNQREGPYVTVQSKLLQIIEKWRNNRFYYTSCTEISKFIFLLHVHFLSEFILCMSSNYFYILIWWGNIYFNRWGKHIKFKESGKCQQVNALLQVISLSKFYYFFLCFNGLNIFLTKSILYSGKIVIFMDKCHLPLAFQVELNCTKIPGVERPSAPQLVQINGQQAVGHPPGLERQPKGVCLFTGAHLYHWHLKGWSLTSLFIN